MITGGLHELFLAEPHALAQPQPVRRGAAAGRCDLHRPLAAETAEVDGKHRLKVFEPDGLIGEARPGARVADQAMPGATDRFFEFEKVQHGPVPLSG